MGSTFRYLFKPGQVLFVSARPYLRKVGVPGFAGVVADKTYVLDAAHGYGLLHDMLPFLLTSDRFVEYASQEATGSMNPRLLWGAMQRYEFHLPPIDDQERIADLLWALERHRLSVEASRVVTAQASAVWAAAAFESIKTCRRLADGVAGSAYGPRFSNSLYSKDGSYRLLRTTDMDDLGHIDYSTMPRANLDSAFNPHLLRDGDFLISRSGTCGVPAVFEASRGGDRVIPGAFLIRLRLNDELDPHYLRAFFNSAPGRGITAALAQGGVQKNIRGSSLLEVQIPFPSRRKQQELLTELMVCERAHNALDAETITLSTLRSAILNDVFGGN